MTKVRPRFRDRSLREMRFQITGASVIVLAVAFALAWRFVPEPLPKLVRLGRELGWTGVALKTCKTQSGALLSCCWAKAHGMTLMVQDLTNPMLAQVPHVLLGAKAGTIMGVETNAMQFYPAASAAEEKVHPGLYQRRNGVLDLSSIKGSGFGYRIDEIERILPEPVVSY